MIFSRRTAWDLSENEFAAAVRERRLAGQELLDLTVSNPTACGFHYDVTSPLASVQDSAAMQYVAHPLGMISAREAVALYYRDAGADVASNRICLTTSTSEAYSYLFRLLCNPGEEVLIARPSYPLFAYIAQLDDVVLREFPLHYDPNADEQHGWSIDLHELASAITPRTRAVILVHPNNPTGNFVSGAERKALTALCAERGIALIVDEVFLDYALGLPQPSFAAGEMACLTFVLSGISKVCGLPQMKLSWIATCGPAGLVVAAMERIEVIADTFLSVNAPVQLALPTWLAQRHSLQRQIIARMKQNLAALDAHVRGSSAQRLTLEAGWTAILRVPRTIEGGEFAQTALGGGVLVQPGLFYGLGDGRVVLSLLTPPENWARGLALLRLDD
jgi:alanine-synthesizing transaminase